MILLDTNIISETWKPRPESSVIGWLKTQPFNSLYLCAPVLAELRFGAERLDAGLRRNLLRASIDHLENVGYRGRILVLDGPAAGEFGRLAAKRERLGRTMGLIDAMIAAIALTHRSVLATRDVDGFAGLDLEIVNPFEFEAG